jgi:broad specificity phosphatase PhoE
MKEIIIVRHGEATHLTEGLTGGWTDSHLTPTGEQQARLTGEFLAEALSGRSLRFYTSDLARAVETAHLIAPALGVGAEPEPNLRELNNGAAANMTVADSMALMLPLTLPAIDWMPYPEAETWRLMYERVAAFMERASREHEEIAVIVAHGFSAAAAIHWWLDLGEDAWERLAFELDPCSLTRLTLNMWGQQTIHRLNETGHLRAAGLAKW